MNQLERDEIIESWNTKIRAIQEEKVFKKVNENFRFIVKIQLNHNKFWVHDRKLNMKVSPKFDTLQEAQEYRLELRKRLSEIL